MQADPSVYQCDHHDRGYSLGLAAYRIVRCGGERFSRLGSKKSSLQGLAGEVLTICKRGCFASEDWRGVNVAEHGFGTSRFAVIVVTGARRAPAPSERLRR